MENQNGQSGSKSVPGFKELGEICPWTGLPHHFSREPMLRCVRSRGSVTVWQCNDCLALHIESWAGSSVDPFRTTVPDPESLRSATTNGPDHEKQGT